MMVTSTASTIRAAGRRLVAEGLQQEGLGEAALADQVVNEILAADRDAVRVVAAD
jgi:hypothetical protein